jgi:hypothetical protein
MHEDDVQSFPKTMGEALDLPSLEDGIETRADFEERKHIFSELAMETMEDAEAGRWWGHAEL